MLNWPASKIRMLIRPVSGLAARAVRVDPVMGAP